MKLIQLAKSFWTEEEGVTAIEYGLIAALVAVAIVVGAGILGTSLDGLFTRLGNCMATPTAAVCALVV
jgi:pilus assembly protein Flp/PilA